MANIGSAFNRFLSLFLLLLHLGCFVFLPRERDPSDDPPPTSRKRKISPLSGDQSPPPAPRLRRSTTTKALVSSWSYIKRVFSCKPTNPPPPPLSLALTSARSSQKSIIAPDQINLFPENSTINYSPPPAQESDISSSTTDQHFPLRNDIFPCTACGEILPKPHLLEQHLAVKHVVSVLGDGGSGNNIVRIIFKAGWSCKEKSPAIHRILKIHNSPKVLTRFEEYRELVKAKASKIGRGRRDERCIADGNELLRFHCATFLCDLGLNGGGGGSFGSGSSSLCNQQYCSVCGIINSGFSPKMDGIPTLSTSWRAHEAIPEEIEEEFQFMNLKRAMLVCRVIAGRVGSEMEEEEEVDKDGGGVDSLVGRGVGNDGGLHHHEEELLVFSPKAVLPCFVIVYTV